MNTCSSRAKRGPSWSLWLIVPDLDSSIGKNHNRLVSDEHLIFMFQQWVYLGSSQLWDRVFLYCTLEMSLLYVSNSTFCNSSDFKRQESK